MARLVLLGICCTFLSVVSDAFLPWHGQRYRPGPVTDGEALLKARKVLQNYPLVDGHNFLPHQYRSRVENTVDLINLEQDVNRQWGPSQTDIPRLREGQVGAVFWTSFIRCTKQFKDATRAILEQIDVTGRMIDKYPDHFVLVTTAQGIEDAFASGKIGGVMGVEGGHGIDSSLGALRTLYKLGVRFLQLTHNCNTPWADSGADEPANDGLSKWGVNVVLEMNRLGMMIDLAHAAQKTREDVLTVSQAPVIFTHTNPWTLCNHILNIPDNIMDRTAAGGGLVMITFIPSMLNCQPSEDRDADIKLVADHIEYVRNRVGVDHVGIGSDYDGGSVEKPKGLNDTSRFPYLFAELAKRGWNDWDMEKVAGRNLVRVFTAVERVSKQMQESGVRPYDSLIPEMDIPEEHECRTKFDS